MPAWTVSAFLLSSALQVLLLLVTARGDGLAVHARLVALTILFQCSYLAYAALSVRAPSLCLALCPLSVLPPLLFPATFPFFTYICSISTLTYLPHVVSLCIHPAQFDGWPLSLRAFFLVSYIDVRDAEPVKPPTWTALKSLLLQEARGALIENGLVLLWAAALWGLPSAQSFTATWSAAMAAASWTASLYSVSVLYARYALTLLLCTSALAFTDRFYGLVFLALSLRAYASQHAPLSAPSLSAFWGGRWNRAIHARLYRALYLPVTAVSARPLGALAAFAGSAVLHAWPAWVAGMQPHYVAMMAAFFLCHGVLTGLERALGFHQASAAWGRVGLWSAMAATLPLICDPLFSLYGLF